MPQVKQLEKQKVVARHKLLNKITDISELEYKMNKHHSKLLKKIPRNMDKRDEARRPSLRPSLRHSLRHSLRPSSLPHDKHPRRCPDQ